MARQAGLDLASLRGSGPHGRVIKRDIEAALTGGAPAAVAAPVAAAALPTAAGPSASGPSAVQLADSLINWLSNDDDFISIPIKTINDKHIELSLVASTIIAFGFILVLPLIFLGTGLTVWWRRKKQ